MQDIYWFLLAMWWFWAAKKRERLERRAGAYLAVNCSVAGSRQAGRNRKNSLVSDC